MYTFRNTRVTGMGVATGGTGWGRIPRFKILGGRPPEIVMFFRKKIGARTKIFRFSNILGIKRPKSEEKLEFEDMWD